jgi:hypothetical protein
MNIRNIIICVALALLLVQATEGQKMVSSLLSFFLFTISLQKQELTFFAVFFF